MIDIRNLRINFNGNPAVKGISYEIFHDEVLAIVGESGSGKSVSSLAIMGLLPEKKCQVSGHITLHEEGKSLEWLELDKKDQRLYRGKKVSMIFQEPMTSLNPVIPCGEQVMELILLHEKCSKKEAQERCLALFEQVKLPRPAQLMASYPHELSGGQRQRVMIAMAIACKPDLLIADEPTTALDVTVQKTILDLLKEIQRETGMSVLFITHDLGVVKNIADRVLVMHKGEIVEQGTCDQVFNQPSHPYTKGLLACRPGMGQRLKVLPTVADFLSQKTVSTETENPEERKLRHEQLYAQEPFLKVADLNVWFPQELNWLGKPGSYIMAVNGISFDLYKGETLGLIGESGCGKSTLGRAIIGLNPIHSGDIQFDGKSLKGLDKKDWKRQKRKVQFIFQDPYSSLNPKHRIGKAIIEPMLIHGLAKSKAEARRKAEMLLEKVGLEAAHFDRYPHEFSGGQRQRIGIARALGVQPEMIICDESVSALDVSVQAQVLNLLNKLKQEFQLTYIFISHDMSVVKHMSDRLLVMNKGRMEEFGDADGIYQSPQSAFTQQLMEAIPE